jgi:hypothetical protein
MRKRTRPILSFETEAEERRFWESHDPADHLDWSQAERVRLPNLRPSTTSISLACRSACSSGSSWPPTSATFLTSR